MLIKVLPQKVSYEYPIFFDNVALVINDSLMTRILNRKEGEEGWITLGNYDAIHLDIDTRILIPDKEKFIEKLHYAIKNNETEPVKFEI